jgi:hypothetical protein
VHLEGIRHLYLDGTTEWAFHPGRFRAVKERPTDITIFKELTNSATAKAVEALHITPSGLLPVPCTLSLPKGKIRLQHFFDLGNFADTVISSGLTGLGLEHGTHGKTRVGNGLREIVIRLGRCGSGSVSAGIGSGIVGSGSICGTFVKTCLSLGRVNFFLVPWVGNGSCGSCGLEFIVSILRFFSGKVSCLRIIGSSRSVERSLRGWRTALWWSILWFEWFFWFVWTFFVGGDGPPWQGRARLEHTQPKGARLRRQCVVTGRRHRQGQGRPQGERARLSGVRLRRRVVVGRHDKGRPEGERAHPTDGVTGCNELGEPVSTASRYDRKLNFGGIVGEAAEDDASLVAVDVGISKLVRLPYSLSSPMEKSPIGDFLQPFHSRGERTAVKRKWQSNRRG